jgi:hypothetical protein
VSPLASFDLVLPDLATVEKCRPDVLVVDVIPGQRPLSGLLEQVDWRMCGLVSRFLQRGLITGEVGERVLVPPARHVSCSFLLLVGAGPASGPSSLACNRALGAILEGVEMLEARRVVMTLPGRLAGGVSAFVAAQLLLARLEDRANRLPPAFFGERPDDEEGPGLELIVAEDEEGQREVSRVLGAQAETVRPRSPLWRG